MFLAFPKSGRRLREDKDTLNESWYFMQDSETDQAVSCRFHLYICILFALKGQFFKELFNIYNSEFDENWTVCFGVSCAARMENTCIAIFIRSSY